ncbi:phosphoenolpyruvate--protein phosphotransferase [Tumebacillus sp. ITR2]|uniref:Phosphoenolpyruvate-protein phosphotransferase n=1 Tax=Tumebacillus amylolyticus TaxID=2801339 RepID=A0ABS1JCA9_9BACL|nr:phosphoenolpyruvate--protein phosphotransferase [Tumebacillus amylolyticus]MBL0387845.1 phosphoenolpyruvate--protein phosphotransferase [Tumebacillus amylolyticus]
MAELRFSGLGVSPGIRIGNVWGYRPGAASVASVADHIEASDVEAEWARLSSAKDQSLSELHALVEKTKETLGEEKATILAGQTSILADPMFYPEIERQIQGQLVPAERAVQNVVASIAALFESMPQEYMRERAADVRDVGNRLLTNLSGGQRVSLSDIREEVVLVADDLTPSDTVQLDKTYILGIITRVGGKTSHTAILAKSLGIPAVLGVGKQIESLQNGDTLLFDGTTGDCILHPDAATVEEYRKSMEAERGELEVLSQFTHQPAISKDGHRIEVAANIGTVAESQMSLEQGAEGIGLFRTEFLFMNATSMPTEEEQFEAYRAVAENLRDHPVVIRTLDIGGDKELSYLELPKELNPFLGYRAIRLCLDRPELLVTQLRAILRASHYGKLKVMFPMISNLDEWRAAKALYRQAQEQLTSENIPFDDAMEVGIMVEIPSAALLADLFAQEVDFFSIGTNDLVQYTVAVDRMNEKVANLYDYFHPSVLRLIKTVIDAAHARGKWVGMCGGMAGDELATPLLLGLGLDEWSMDGGSIAKIKRAVRSLDRAECEQIANSLLSIGTASEIREQLKPYLHR